MIISRKSQLRLPLVAVLIAVLVASCGDVGDAEGEPPVVDSTSQALRSSWVALDDFPAGSPAELRFDAQKSDQSVSYFDLKIHGFYAEPKQGPNGEYTKISVPGLGSVGSLGAPALPVFRGDLAVVTAAREARIRVVSRGNTQSFPALNVWPEPAPELDAPGRPERFVQNAAIYASKATWPGSDGASLHKVRTKLDGMLGVSIESYPFKWNPASKLLTVDANVRYAVDHAGVALPVQSITKERALSAQNRFVNWGVARRYFEINLKKFIGDFLFVYPAKYKEEIAPLVAQKKARGYLVTERTTEVTGSSCASVRAAIQGWYASRFLASDKYAILVGDVDAIATCVSPAGDPTDDLYASTDGDDLDEEIYLGRLSVDNETDLTNQVTKILGYEDSPGLFNYGKALLVAHKEGAPGKYVGAHESVRTAAYAVAPTFSTQYGHLAGVDNASVSAAINAGQGLVAYRGHGDVQEWWAWNVPGQSFFNADVIALTNPATKTPVLWSFACSNSALSTSDSFGEVWMEDPDNRAVSFYGATVPSATFENHELDRQMFKAVYDLGLTRQGKAIEYAEAQMAALAGSGNAWMYLLLGDPEMSIRRRTPFKISIATAQLLSVCKIGVNCELIVYARDPQGRPLAGAKISVYKGSSQGEDEVLDNAYADAEGRAVIPAPTRTPGKLFVTVEGDMGDVERAIVEVR